MNPPMGDDFTEGEMGVVDVEFDGVNLGYTMEDSDLERIKDEKDIKFAQLGTQPSDKIGTGAAWKFTCKMGETTLARLNKVMDGLTVVGHNAKLGQDIYRSGYDNFAKRLVLRRVNSDGTPSTDAAFRTTFYKAYPTVSGSVAGPMGPDSQRGTQVVFFMFYDRTRKCHGFIGRASSLGL
jgi:hypothetical protein